MKTTHCLLLFTAILISSLTADTIVLKTGKKYEGRIISQDEKSYLVEIQVTKSIKDERRILKDHVQEIIKEAKDAKDFEKIKTLTPTPDRLKVDQYKERIQSAKDFLTKFPRSANTKAVKAILQTLEKEHKVVANGGLKLGGQLITASDVEANGYDIHARILLIDMNTLAANGRNQQALRKWEMLKNKYDRSSAYKNSLSAVTRILNAHTAEVKNNIRTLEARKAKRESALKSLGESDRERTLTVLAEKQKAYEALIEKEEKVMKTKWLTIDPYNKKALEYNLRNSESVLNRLQSSSSKPVALAGPAFRGAWSALAKGDLEEAAKMVKQLESMRLPEEYTMPLVKELEEKQVTKAAADKAAKERAARELLEKMKAEEAAKAAEADKKNKSKKKPRPKNKGKGK